MKGSSYILRKRVLSVFIAVVMVFVCIFGRFSYLQLIKAEELGMKALDQWTRHLPIEGGRGEIFDRNGNLLATNETVYDLYVRPRMVTDKTMLSAIASEVLGLDFNKIFDRLSLASTSEFTLKKDVSEEDMKILVEREVEGIYYTIATKRYYPYDNLLSKVLGYCSVDGEGQAGLESYYNQYLKGIDGEFLTQTDLLGREIKGSSAYITESFNGLDLHLTIDIEVQEIVENVLKRAVLSHNPKSTSAIVMEVNTGEIIAMGELPNFDLNNPPRGDLSSLLALQRNSIVVDIYEPGSTFKVLTAASNIEEWLRGNKNAFPLDYVYNSSPTRFVDGQRIKCWSTHSNGKHSHLDLSGALDNSCNPIFVDIALALGVETMYDYIEAFGYGKSLGIDFAGEASGMLVNEGIVKNCDLARIGFGQTVAVSPLQLVSATNAVINGGYLLQPKFMKEITTTNGKKVITNPTTVISQPISEKASEIMREYLINVVVNGSGKHAQVENVTVGGKTGTAQKYENGVIASGKYISSFVGFFTAGENEYITLVLVDEPKGEYYGSTVAGPLAQGIIEGMNSLYA